MLPDRLAEARASGRRVRIAAAGTWLDAGRPVRATDTLSVAELRGIVEYVPGDLTLTARAGTPLSELYAATRQHEQWLPLDPWGGDTGTIGATISTASAGPHAFAMGAPRDVVLGLEFVSGAGDTIRAGGRVVKNVAGFDLARLVIGSWGTLGVVTEVTVRLRARPPQTRTIAIAVQESAAALTEMAVRLRALPFTLLAAELVNAPLARALGVGNQSIIVARTGGNAASIARQLDLLRGLASVSDAPAGLWARLRAHDRQAVASWRWSAMPSQFGNTWMSAAAAVKELDGARLSGSVLRGIVRVSVAGAPAPDRLTRAATSFSGIRVIEQMPAGAWPAPVPRSTANLEHELRARFDPDGILNPGIMGDGR